MAVIFSDRFRMQTLIEFWISNLQILEIRDHEVDLDAEGTVIRDRRMQM